MKALYLIFTILLFSCVNQREAQYDDLLFELYSYGDDATLILEVGNLDSATTIQDNYASIAVANYYFVDPNHPGQYFFEIDLDDLEAQMDDGEYVIPREVLSNINVYAIVPITSHGKVVTSNGRTVGRDRQVK